jgi:hypothetical protein
VGFGGDELGVKRVDKLLLVRINDMVFDVVLLVCLCVYVCL